MSLPAATTVQHRPTPAPPRLALDSARVRADFPILTQLVHGKPLIYFDNANTSQKPRAVIEAVDDFYRRHNANVSRAVQTLGEEATSAYEATRDKLARFINAPSRDEIVLNVVRAQDFTPATEEALLAEFRRVFGPGIAIRPSYVERIAQERSGKYRFSICRV